MSYSFVLLFFCSCIFCSILWCAHEKDKGKGAHPHFDVLVSPYPWVDSIAMLAVPPPAASTTEAVDLSSGAAILRIRGLLLVLLPFAYIYRRLCSVRGGTLISIYCRWLRWLFSPCGCHMRQVFIFSSLPLVYCSCPFAFWSYFAGISCVRTRTHTWVQIMLYTSYCCFYCRTLQVSVLPALFCGTVWM